ncbi:glycerate kinase type-2 family protein [Pseudodesulfovibrio piezophilus]|uniref:Glycerate kinase n=1 Tax=Pseudodesulfovibrio piezophilus (strain DSM 21447 / JCM 15486 / C1TLV30) TaxID=1322246 RepID=M1WR82_PSEP2|nr:glycerate kinase [Pseudodesulfovibrio piezophilus]CCH48167.1 Glycerate kinase [Pseudodesulfovibrio piezophilus C1TLV30]
MTSYIEKQAHLHHIVERTINAVSPDPAIRSALKLDGDVLTVAEREYDLNQFERIFVLGAGKASAAMAETLEKILGNRLHGGIMATKYNHGLKLRKTRVLESNHPVPDLAGERAAKELISLAKGISEKDLVFCLLSGGASAIVPAPRHPVTLAIKQETTRKLLECGATINEINAIRKHLSFFKGGHFAKALEPATVLTLIISDVVGDYLDVIGSGPTAPDESTFFDCQAILDKYGLCGEIPDEVTQVISDGCEGKTPETCKEGDACFERVQNVIIAGNAMAVAGAAEAAREKGYTPIVVDHSMEGEARDVAKRLIRLAGEYSQGHHEIKPPVCLLAGGETTVTIRGNGKGGRNQELALAGAIELSGMQCCRENISVLCLGTDGSDGPTDAAGAFVFPDTVARSQAQSRSAREYLENNNAYEFFTNTGTLLKTGPTRTNVMDVVAILVD